MILFLKFTQRYKHFGRWLNKDKECEDYNLKNQIAKSTELVLNLTKKIMI